MDFFDIEAFIALSEAGNFSVAAKKLYISQPTLSQRIQRLEGNLGYSVITRQRGRLAIELTEHGKEFLVIAKQITRLLDQAYTIDEKEEAKLLRISLNETIMTSLLPGIIRTFTNRYPDVKLSVHSYYSNESYELVGSGKLDLAIVSLDLPHSSEVVATPIVSEGWKFVCGRNASYPSDISSPKELDKGKLMIFCNLEKTTWYSDWFTTSIAPALEGFTCAFLENDPDAFNNEKWSVLPASIANHFIERGVCESRELLVRPKNRRIYALTRKDVNNEYIDAFIECARECFDEILLDDIRILI